MGDDERGVYAVMFSNYEPAEIAALYDNREAAEAHADDAGDGWRVVFWRVASEYRPDEP